MTEMNKMNEQELENVAGGHYGVGYDSGWKTVRGLQSGSLAIRTTPEAKYENQVNHIGLQNGDKVHMTGSYMRGTGFGGAEATYAWVYVPKFGISGYVNAAYIG